MPWATDEEVRSEKFGCGIMTMNGIAFEDCDEELKYVCKLGKSSCGPKYDCPIGYISYQDKCYWFSQTPSLFDDAINDCKSKEATLVEVPTEDFQNWLQNIIIKRNSEGKTTNKQFWLGISNASTGMWDSQTPITFQKWCDNNSRPRHGEPAFIDGCWKEVAHISVAKTKKNYICEKAGVSHG